MKAKMPMSMPALIKIIFIWGIVFIKFLCTGQTNGFMLFSRSLLFTVIVSVESGLFVIEFQSKQIDFDHCNRNYNKYIIPKLMADITFAIWGFICYGTISMILTLPLIIIEAIRLIQSSLHTFRLFKENGS